MFILIQLNHLNQFLRGEAPHFERLQNIASAAI